VNKNRKTFFTSTSQNRAILAHVDLRRQRRHFLRANYSARGGLFTGRHIAKTPAMSDCVAKTPNYDRGTDAIHGAQPTGRAGGGGLLGA